MTGVVLVTGGSRGIGAATARLAGAQGYAVAANYRVDAGQAAAVVDAIKAAGGRAVALQADISDEAAIPGLFDRAEDALGPLTALVNSAGVTGGPSTAAEVDVATLRRVVGINVLGTFLCAREAVRRMARSRGGGGGAIVNLSSAAAYLGGAGEFVHYAMTKGAIDSLTVGLGREVAADGIRVNAVRPGLIDTEMNRHPGDPDRLARLGPTVPMARVGAAEEVAEVILWLLSDAASYVTASVVNVGGGR